MPRHRLTNEEILRMLRYHEEANHRRCQEYFFDVAPLTIPLSLPVPEVHLEHIQSSCKKSMAIYTITPHLEEYTEAYCQQSLIREDIMYSVYEQWFRDHNVDIDFGNFVAKLIRIEIPLK